MTRWDSPLFTVLYEDETPPFEQMWEALIGSGGQTKIVRPNAATVLVRDTFMLFLPAVWQIADTLLFWLQKPATEQNHLYELDKTTSDIVSEITSWQKDHPGEAGGEITIKDVDDKIQLPTSTLSLPALQRLKRQFITLNRQHTLEKSRIRQLFVEHLNDAFGG